MKAVKITPDWEPRLQDMLADLNVHQVRVDLLPQYCYCVLFLAAVMVEGKLWTARMVLDEMDPMLGSLDEIAAKLREVITDPKYRNGSFKPSE